MWIVYNKCQPGHNAFFLDESAAIQYAELIRSENYYIDYFDTSTGDFPSAQEYTNWLLCKTLAAPLAIEPHATRINNNLVYVSKILTG